jgi:hypothetical protein
MAGTWRYEGNPLPLSDFRQIEEQVATSARPKQQEVRRILNRFAFTVESFAHPRVEDCNSTKLRVESDSKLS